MNDQADEEVWLKLKIKGEKDGASNFNLIACEVHEEHLPFSATNVSAKKKKGNERKAVIVGNKGGLYA